MSKIDNSDHFLIDSSVVFSKFLELMREHAFNYHFSTFCLSKLGKFSECSVNVYHSPNNSGVEIRKLAKTLSVHRLHRSHTQNIQQHNNNNNKNIILLHSPGLCGPGQRSLCPLARSTQTTQPTFLCLRLNSATK